MLPYANRVVEHPRRYQLVKVPGTEDVYDLVPVPGNITNAGRAMNKEFFDSIKTDIDSKLNASLKASQAEAEAATNDTKYMTALKVLQQINALALPSKQMSIKTGTISNNGTIPQTSGYSNYIYLVTLNSVDGMAGDEFPDSYNSGGYTNIFGYKQVCEVDQSTRNVTVGAYHYYLSTSGASSGWRGWSSGTANYIEIAFN